MMSIPTVSAVSGGRKRSLRLHFDEAHVARQMV
jgi:hypothetical protein